MTRRRASRGLPPEGREPQTREIFNELVRKELVVKVQHAASTEMKRKAISERFFSWAAAALALASTVLGTVAMIDGLSDSQLIDPSVSMVFALIVGVVAAASLVVFVVTLIRFTRRTSAREDRRRRATEAGFSAWAHAVRARQERDTHDG